MILINKIHLCFLVVLGIIGFADMMAFIIFLKNIIRRNIRRKGEE